MLVGVNRANIIMKNFKIVMRNAVLTEQDRLQDRRKVGVTWRCKNE